MNIFERFDSFRRAMRKQNIRLRTVHDRPGCFIGERPSEKIPDEFETCLEIEGGLHGVRLKIYPDLEVCGLQMLEQALDLAKAALTDEYKLAAYRAAPETFRTAPVLRTFRDPRCLEEPFKKVLGKNISVIDSREGVGNRAITLLEKIKDHNDDAKGDMFFVTSVEKMPGNYKSISSRYGLSFGGEI